MSLALLPWLWSAESSERKRGRGQEERREVEEGGQKVDKKEALQRMISPHLDLFDFFFLFDIYPINACCCRGFQRGAAEHREGCN